MEGPGARRSQQAATRCGSQSEAAQGWAEPLAAPDLPLEDPMNVIIKRAQTTWYVEYGETRYY